MALFYCAWATRASLLVDAASVEDAARIAEETARADSEAMVGKPRRIFPVPVGVFAADVVFEPLFDEGGTVDGEDEVFCEPLDHCAELFARFEDENDAEAEADDVAGELAAPPAALRLVRPSPDGQTRIGDAYKATQCGAEAEDERGALVYCTKAPGHPGNRHGNGEVEWES